MKAKLIIAVALVLIAAFALTGAAAANADTNNEWCEFGTFEECVINEYGIPTEEIQCHTKQQQLVVPVDRPLRPLFTSFINESEILTEEIQCHTKQQQLVVPVDRPLRPL